MDVAPEPFEVVVSNHWVTLRHRGEEVFVLAVSEDGQLAASAPSFDAIAWYNDAPPAGRALRVEVVHRLTKALEEGRIEPPQRTVIGQDAAPVVIDPQVSVPVPHYVGTVPHIGEHERDDVLDEILDSEMAHPDMPIRLREQETHRIAAKFNLKLMQVAGVRAALTRGAYGDFEVLKSERLEQKGKPHAKSNGEA